ncbi:MAG: farnesyl diphosphate synthase [Hyphomicrobiales bacterium]
MQQQSFETALAETAATMEQELDRLLPDTPARLRQAMRYASLSQGKRLRPFLVMQSAALFDVAEASARRVAAALECVHCYSLVHDDLPAMDDDDLRRGLPTTHKKFDEATAILSGDGLLTFAFEILADAATHGDAAVRAELVLELARASGEAGMVGGQMRDIEAESGGFASAEAIAAMQGMKTGALFRFACEAGAIMARQGRGALRQYADDLGLAFQIADDILDVESDAATLGKAAGKDKARGKATFVDFLGLDGAKAEARRLVDKACAAVAPYGARAGLMQDAARFIITRKK